MYIVDWHFGLLLIYLPLRHANGDDDLWSCLNENTAIILLRYNLWFVFSYPVFLHFTIFRISFGNREGRMKSTNVIINTVLEEVLHFHPVSAIKQAGSHSDVVLEVLHKNFIGI